MAKPTWFCFLLLLVVLLLHLAVVIVVIAEDSDVLNYNEAWLLSKTSTGMLTFRMTFLNRYL